MTMIVRTLGREIEKAKARREALVAELAGLEQLIPRLEDAAATVASLPAAATPPTRLRGRPAEMIVAIKSILARHGGSMTRGDIVRALEAARVPVPGDTPSNKGKYVGTLLWRAPDIARKTANGYALK